MAESGDSVEGRKGKRRATADRATQLPLILDQLPDGVLAVDPGSTVTLCNATFRRWVGRDLTGASLADLLQEYSLEKPDGERFAPGETPIERALAGEVVVGAEVAVALPGGFRVALLENASPLASGRDGFRGAVVTATDITAQKAALAERERLLREVEAANRNLRTTVDRLPDGVLVIDTERRVIMNNEATRCYVGHDLVGIDLAELRRQHEFVMTDGRPFAPGEAPSDRALQGEATTGVPVRILHIDGHVVDALESAAPLYDAEGRLASALVALTDITPMRQAEAERERLLTEVQQARADLHAIIDHLPEWVFVVDPSMRVLMTNEAVRRFLGHEATGRLLPEIWREYGELTGSERPFPPGATPFHFALEGKAISGVEASARRADGSTIYLLVNAVPLRGAGGEVESVVVTVTDITAQKEAQSERERLLAEVEAGRENLRTILERIPSGVIVADTAQRITLANDMAKQFLGTDIVGRIVGEVVRFIRFEEPDGRSLPPERWPIPRALAGELVSNMQVRARLPDGRIVALLASAIALRDVRGGITGAVLAATDITAQEQAQAERERLLAEVERGRESLRTIINSLPDGVLVIAPDGRVTLYNQTMRDHLGEDVTGAQVTALCQRLGLAMADGRPFPEGEMPFDIALRGEPVIGQEAIARPPAGPQIDLLVSAAPLLEPDGRVREVVMVLTDITPLKDLDRAKDQFFSVAAHELRTPLTSLRGNAQMLLRRAEQAGWEERDLQNLRTIDGQVDRLNDLIGRLLDVSRIRLGRLQINREPMDLVALAQQVAADMQVTSQAHRIVAESEVPQLIASWDPSALQQVLTNLIGNAIKYVPGGDIEVCVRRRDGEAVVTVTDHGPGIPPDKQARLFQAFTRGAAKEYREGGGLGLGLYISRGIVQAHGGRIWVESQPGAGSTFAFALPIEGS